jgi:hypothetical protein
MINFCLKIKVQRERGGPERKTEKRGAQKSSINHHQFNGGWPAALRDTVPLRGNNHFHNSPGQYLRQISNNFIRDGVFALAKIQIDTRNAKK